MASMLNWHILLILPVFLLTSQGSLGIETITVLEGTFDMQLTCPSIKDDEKSTTYSWYHNGDELYDDPMKHDSVKAEKLTFFAVSRKDSGTYLCHVQSGETSYNHTFFVEVNYPPEFNSIPEPLHIVDKYSSVYLDCDVDGRPASRVEWFKDGQVLQSHGRFLSLYTVTSADIGSYQCNASNEYGSVTSEPMQLSFYVAVHFSKLLPEKVDVDCHGSVTLECLTDGKPQPLIQWFKYDQELQSSDYIEINDTALKITNVSSHETGSYMCVAWNSFGDILHQVQQTTFISVKSVPEAVNVTLTFIDTTTVSVEWRPSNDGGYPIKYIQIEYCQFVGNKTAWFHLPTVDYQAEKQTSYAIRDLQPNGHYQLNVQAVNEIGVSPVTTLNFTVDSKKNRVLRQIDDNPTQAPLPSNISKFGYIVFIIIGVLIAFAMLLFICIVVASFCRLFCHGREATNVFDDKFYTGPGIEHPELKTESYELLETNFDVVQRKESSQQLIQLD